MFALDTVSEKLTYYFGAFIVWSGLFIIVNNKVILSSKISKREADDLRNRIISIFHGLFAFFVSGYHIYNDNPQYADKATPIQHLILLTSGAYFLYDTIACHYYGLSDLSLFIHHGMCTVGIIACEMTNNATTALIGLFWAEISNCPMHVRVILRTLKMRYTKIFEFSESFYLVTYMICRGIFCTHLAITATPVSETPILIRLVCLGLWIQSLFFIYEMFGILKRKLKQYKERSQKKISYFWFTDNPKLSELSYYKTEAKDKIF